MDNGRRPRSVDGLVVGHFTARRVVEADLQAGRQLRGHELEVRVLADEVEEVLGHVKGMVDLALEPVVAVVLPGKGELERVGASAALERQISEVPDIGIVAAVEQIAGRGGVGAVEDGHVRTKQERAGARYVHHLVRVDGDGVGKVASLELPAVLLREDDGTAEAGINVHPEPVLLADGRDFLKRLVRASDRGAARGIDVERSLALGLGPDDHLAEGVGLHAASLVDRDGPDGAGAHAAHHGALLDRVVAVGAGEDHEVARGISSRAAFGVQGVAGDDQRGQIGGATSLASDASGIGAVEAKQLGQSSCRGLFNHRQGRRDLIHVNLRKS